MSSQTRVFAGVAALALCTATLFVFRPALQNKFIEFDDRGYVTANYHVRQGLTWETVIWSFRTGHTGNWHPLTWLSHALDCQLYGLNPAGHHLTSILIHTASAALLFVILRRSTGALWRSVFVAGFFALHPLRVESVAWAAERKDVLSGLFFMLTLWAYLAYVQKSESRTLTARSGLPPDVVYPSSNRGPLTCGRYWLVMGFFALGLMSKPMLVTLPLVLLLLDYWPLERFRVNFGRAELPALRRLVQEKLPLLLLAALASAVTFIVQSKGGNTGSLPVAFRAANSVVASAAYCGKMLWPHNLAVFYPRPEVWPLGKVLAAVFVLSSITAMVVWLGRSRRYLVAGWLWYLIMLTPVCGLVSIGAHALADRYTYLPGIGLLLMMVWGTADLAGRWSYGRAAVGAAAMIALVTCGFSTARELHYWKDNRTLFERALQVTSGNYIAYLNVSSAFALNGERGKALEYCQRALKIQPASNDAWNQLAVLLADEGRMQEALEAANTAIRVEPDFAAEPHYTRGTIWEDLKRPTEASADFEKVLQFDPDHVEARVNLANLLATRGEFEPAIQQLAAALHLNPDHAIAHYDLANALARSGRPTEAIAHYERAIRLAPTNAPAHCNLGMMLMQQNQADAALARFQEALRMDPTLAQAHYGAGSVLAKRGLSREAITHLRQALEPNPDFPAALNQLAVILATQPEAKVRNGSEAVQAASRACRLTGTNTPLYLETLAAAYAENGNFSNAVLIAQQACDLARAAGQRELEDHSRKLLELFRAGSAFHQQFPVGQ